jgi:hypothetical protein
MTRDEAQKLIGQSGSPERAVARLRSRMRREQRAEARKIGVTVETLRRERFKAAVEQSFALMQGRVVPNVLKVKDG